MRIAGRQQEDVQMVLLVADGVERGGTRAFSDADSMSQGHLLRHRQRGGP